MQVLQPKKLVAAIATVAGLALSVPASAVVMDYAGTGGAVPPSGSSGIFTSSISVTDDLSINDVSVTLTDFNHSWTGDILATLTYDDGSNPTTSIDLFGTSGALGPNINTNGTYIFADAGLAGFPNATPGTYAANDPFSTFDSLSSMALWTLSLNDQFNGDSGSLGSWTLSVDGDAANVPEPGSLALLGLGLAGLGFSRRKKAS